MSTSSAPTKGIAFEKYCKSRLESSGFHNVSLTPASGDHGADIIAYKSGKKYAVQCKYYSSPVGNHAVQEVYAAMRHYQCDAAIVMTNSTFTRMAKQTAKECHIELWDKISYNSSTKNKVTNVGCGCLSNVFFLSILLVLIIGLSEYVIQYYIEILIGIFIIIIGIVIYIIKIGKGKYLAIGCCCLVIGILAIGILACTWKYVGDTVIPIVFFSCIAAIFYISYKAGKE